MVVARENAVCNSPSTAVAAPPRGHGCSTGTSVLPVFCLSPVATKGEERRRKREEREKEEKGGRKVSGAAIYIHGRRRAAPRATMEEARWDQAEAEGRRSKEKEKKKEKRLGQLSARVPACPAREKKEETGRALRPAHRPQTLPFNHGWLQLSGQQIQVLS